MNWYGYHARAADERKIMAAPAKVQVRGRRWKPGKKKATPPAADPRMATTASWTSGMRDWMKVCENSRMTPETPSRAAPHRAGRRLPVSANRRHMKREASRKRMKLIRSSSGFEKTKGWRVSGSRWARTEPTSRLKSKGAQQPAVTRARKTMAGKAEGASRKRRARGWPLKPSTDRL